MRKQLFGLLMVSAIAAAQPAASFDVATIKFHPGPITFSRDPSVHGRSVSGIASTLLDLITNAYDVRYDQISGGPKWASSDAYDIEAKAEGEGTLTKDQAQRMMQTLLADRFQLKTHRETREVPAYALLVAKNGHKLKESAADAPGNNFTRGNGASMHMEATRGTMEKLAAQLSHTAGRPVVDRTGLSGYWAFTFDWVPPGAPESDSEAPSMFTALQEQLGLKLEPIKAPREILIIDHAEKPSEN